jgi:peptidoglycan pentaglycine glycine transferase (the first glycine)
MQPFTGNPQSWNELITHLPNPHFLQTWEWGQVKFKYGWQPLPFVWSNAEKIVAAAMVLKRAITIRGFSAKLCVLYVPKGPLMDWNNEALRAIVLGDLQDYAKKQGAIFIKIDPDVVLGTGVSGGEGAVESDLGLTIQSELGKEGWQYSAEQIQFRNTVLIDLSPPEDDMLARMKQKTRYNIRLAAKKGVTIRLGTVADLTMLYGMYAGTSVRDGFVIRDENYYQMVWRMFMQSSMPHAEPLIAELDGEPVAAVFVFFFAGKAYYVYGMSRDAHREKMPTYLLQWEAIRRAKLAGCAIYDLWGAPEAFDESDSMWGVFRFKEGLGGEVVRTLGAWDFVPNKMLYSLYADLMPKILDLMRYRGKARTKQQIGA